MQFDGDSLTNRKWHQSFRHSNVLRTGSRHRCSLWAQSLLCSKFSSCSILGPAPAGGKEWTVEWEVTFAGSMRKKCLWGQSTDICASQVTLMFSPWETAWRTLVWHFCEVKGGRKSWQELLKYSQLALVSQSIWRKSTQISAKTPRVGSEPMTKWPSNHAN